MNAPKLDAALLADDLRDVADRARYLEAAGYTIPFPQRDVHMIPHEAPKPAAE